MRGKRISPEQIIRTIKESEIGVENIDVYRKHWISEQTFYDWRNRYGRMEIIDTMRLKGLEKENRKPKRLVAHEFVKKTGRS